MRFKIEKYADLHSAVEKLCAFLTEREVSAEKVFDSRLVTHELIGNVLQHSGGSAVLEIQLLDGHIQISVRADRTFRPPQEGRCPDGYAERGRGLFLVDKLSVERRFTDEGEILVKIALL